MMAAHGTPPILMDVVNSIMMTSRLLLTVVLVKLALQSTPSNMLAIWNLKIVVVIHVHITQITQKRVETMTL